MNRNDLAEACNGNLLWYVKTQREREIERSENHIKIYSSSTRSVVSEWVFGIWCKHSRRSDDGCSRLSFEWIRIRFTHLIYIDSTRLEPTKFHSLNLHRFVFSISVFFSREKDWKIEFLRVDSLAFIDLFRQFYSFRQVTRVGRGHRCKKNFYFLRQNSFRGTAKNGKFLVFCAQFINFRKVLEDSQNVWMN